MLTRVLTYKTIATVKQCRIFSDRLYIYRHLPEYNASLTVSLVLDQQTFVLHGNIHEFIKDLLKL